jgi:rhodanese-related sulfurtransferase
MKELSRTNRLTIVVVAFVVLLVIGLITIRRPGVTYSLTASQSLALLSQSDNTVPVSQLSAFANEKGKYTFVDIRQPNDYTVNHLKDAINFPLRDLYSKQAKNFFSDLKKAGQTAVLYGYSAQDAASAWYLLKQTGFDNIKYLDGTAPFTNTLPADSAQLLIKNSEISTIDTAFLNNLRNQLNPGGKTETEQAAPKKKTVVTKPSGSSGGGC